MQGVETAYRDERRRALATLVRLLGDLDLAEDALQEAFLAALAAWPREGPPGNPCAWLVSTARHKALDRLRRDRVFAAKRAELARAAPAALPAPELDESPFPDD